MINVFQPSLGSQELEAIERVFRSNWLGKGDIVTGFEQGFAGHLGVPAPSIVSTTSCTEGLFLAAELLALGPGDEVVAPTISFVAVGNAVLSKGATLRCCDVDPRTLNLTGEHLESCLSGRTKAVIVNHYGGVSCPMDDILALCEVRGIAVIEDAACAVASRYRGLACGTMGDMGVWSFDAMKILCCGDGGMMYLRSPELVEKAKEQLYLGLPARQKSGTDSATSGAARWWEVEVNALGRRAIMNNVTAAMGLTQLGRLDAFVARRREIWEMYSRALSEHAWLTCPPVVPEDCTSSYYFYWIQSSYRDRLAKFLLDRGVYTTFRYWPLHRIEFFGLPRKGAPNADRACEVTLNLPIHQSLSESDVGLVLQAVEDFSRSL